MIQFLISLLISTSASAGGDSVTLQSCEAYLLTQGPSHAEGARQWLRGAGQLTMWVEKEQKPNPELNLIEMFDQDSLLNDEPVEIQEAAEEARADFFAALQSLGPTVLTGGQIPLRSGKIFASLEDLTGKIPLSRIDRVALGLDPDQEILAADIGNVQMAVKESSIELVNARLRLDVPLEPMHVGFYYRFPSYNTRPDQLKSPRDFVLEHGIALIEREVEGVRFGYGIGLESVKWGFPVDTLEIRVYLIRECETPVNSVRQPIFPRQGRDSGSLNLCLTDTGLSLNFVQE